MFSTLSRNSLNKWVQSFVNKSTEVGSGGVRYAVRIALHGMVSPEAANGNSRYKTVERVDEV
jgi:hypothetical protein